MTAERRRYDDNGFAGLMSGLPVWVKAALVLGVPAVISLYLVWWGTQRVDARLDAISQVAMQSAPLHYQQSLEAHTALLKEILRTREDMMLILRANCLNSARGNQNAESRCWYPPTQPPQ